MSESKGPSKEAIALYTNVFGCVPDTEALEAGDVWEIAHIDAALRRAKAEGMRLSKHEYQCWEDAMWSAETKDVVTFGQWLDARAAQIEEGE